MGITVTIADLKRIALVMVVMTIVAVIIFTTMTRFANGVESELEKVLDAFGSII